MSTTIVPAATARQIGTEELRVVKNLETNLWREFVAHHPDSSVFHTPEMSAVFNRAKGHSVTAWATVDGSGDVLALLNPVRVSVLGGPLALLTTRSVAFASILCADSREGGEALDLLLRTYNRNVRADVAFTELRNMRDTSALRPVFSKNGFQHEEHLNFLIDLTQPRSEIWNGIRSSAQRNVRKAHKSGVTIEPVVEAQAMSTAYAILRQVYSRIRVPLPDESLFRAAFEILYPKGMFCAFLAKADGAEIGVMTLLQYRGVVTYWYTGTLREYSSARAGDMLVWHALKWGANNGHHTFDFGGGGKPEEKYGVRDFKAKFGGTLVNFGRDTKVHAPVRLRVSEAGYHLVRRFL